MKCLTVLFCLIVVVVNGEPPRGRFRHFQSKPKFPGDRLIAPARQEQPKPIYGPPAANQPPNVYLTPEHGVSNNGDASSGASGVYLPPSRQVDVIENLNFRQFEPDAELIINNNRHDIRSNRLRNGALNAGDAAAVGQSYYIYHPNGLLERITYSPRENLRTVAVTAPLKVSHSRVIAEPIFTYDPVTLAVQRLQ